jgi:hypothetical protein
MVNMFDLETISFIVAIVGLALVGVSTTPALYNLTKRLGGFSTSKNADRNVTANGRAISNGAGEYSSLQGLYQDDDGQATEESSNSFSDRFLHFMISILSITGFLLSLALGIVVTIAPAERSSSLPGSSLLIEQWLQLGIWVCSSPQDLFPIYLQVRPGLVVNDSMNSLFYNRLSYVYNRLL